MTAVWLRRSRVASTTEVITPSPGRHTTSGVSPPRGRFTASITPIRPRHRLHDRRIVVLTMDRSRRRRAQQPARHAGQHLGLAVWRVEGTWRVVQRPGRRRGATRERDSQEGREGDAEAINGPSVPGSGLSVYASPALACVMRPVPRTPFSVPLITSGDYASL